MALRRTWQTAAERFYRKLQWPSARRVAKRDAVQLARPCPSGPGRMAARLQHHPATQQLGQSAASTLRQAQRPGIATGRVAARNRGLRAPPRCHTEPYRLKWPTDSTHPWMTNGAQVSVEKLDDDGGAEVTIFSGGDARQRQSLRRPRIRRVP